MFHITFQTSVNFYQYWLFSNRILQAKLLCQLQVNSFVSLGFWSFLKLSNFVRQSNSWYFFIDFYSLQSNNRYFWSNLMILLKIIRGTYPLLSDISWNSIVKFDNMWKWEKGVEKKLPLQVHDFSGRYTMWIRSKVKQEL